MARQDSKRELECTELGRRGQAPKAQLEAMPGQASLREGNACLGYGCSAQV